MNTRIWIYWRGSSKECADEINEYIRLISEFTGPTEIVGFTEDLSEAPMLSRKCYESVKDAAKLRAFSLLITNALDYYGERKNALEPAIDLLALCTIRVWAKGYGLLPVSDFWPIWEDSFWADEYEDEDDDFE